MAHEEEISAPLPDAQRVLPVGADIYQARPKPQVTDKLFAWSDAADAHTLTPAGHERFFGEVDGPFKRAHPAIVELKRLHPDIDFNIKKSGASARYFQAFHLLWHFPDVAFSRLDLAQFIGEVGLESADVIQLVNKAGQRLFKIHRSGRGRETLYRGVLPIPYDSSKKPLRAGSSNMTQDEKDAQIVQVKEFVKSTWLDAEKWDEGHLDPDDPESAVVMQPSSYNGPLKDRFKFDDRGFPRNPTAKELATNLRKYYATEGELRSIRDAINEEIGSD